MDQRSREVIVDRMCNVEFALQDLLVEDTPESLEWALDATRELHKALKGYPTTDKGEREDECELQPRLSRGLHRT